MVKISTPKQPKGSQTIAAVSYESVEIIKGIKIDRHDLCSKHEEADILITQHAIAASLPGKSVRFVSDDTDMFVLPVHFYNYKCEGTTAAPMIMSSPVTERAVIDICPVATPAHSDIVSNLLAIYGISYADTVPSLPHGLVKA